MFLFLLFTALVSSVWCGSECPSRESVYPCICLHKRFEKKFHTLVICNQVHQRSDMSRIGSQLESTQIDHFIMYDSFQSRQSQSYNIQLIRNAIEVDFTESSISEQMFCGVPSCDNSIKRLTLHNTSLSNLNLESHPDDNRRRNDNCNSRGFKCLDKLVYLELSYNTYLTRLKHEYFQSPLPELLLFNASHNKINYVSSKIFSQALFPKLKKLSLSHNELEEVKQIFSMGQINIEYLDLSYNKIKNSLEFRNLPRLKVLKMEGNKLISFQSNEWQNLPKSLVLVELMGNRLQCDCELSFINSSFPVHTTILGSCESPTEFKGIKLRKVSKLIKIKCDSERNAGGPP